MMFNAVEAGCCRTLVQKNLFSSMLDNVESV